MYQLPHWPSGKDILLKSGRPGFDSRLCHRSFSRSSHASYLENGTPVATLSGTWRYRTSAGTGQPSVSILGVGGIERLIRSFCLSVAACTLV